MAEEEYEILPHQLLSDLKYDVEALKKKLSQPDNKMNELILEIESMKDSIHELNNVFQKALEKTKEEDPYKTIKVLSEKMETVLSQNETIARGMVAISDKLEDFISKQIAVKQPAKGPSPGLPVQHMMGPPKIPGARTAPPPKMMGSEEPNIDFPPPPPSATGPNRKKKSISGLFK